MTTDVPPAVLATRSPISPTAAGRLSHPRYSQPARPFRQQRPGVHDSRTSSDHEVPPRRCCDTGAADPARDGSAFPASRALDPVAGGRRVCGVAAPRSGGRRRRVCGVAAPRSGGRRRRVCGVAAPRSGGRRRRVYGIAAPRSGGRRRRVCGVAAPRSGGRRRRVCGVAAPRSGGRRRRVCGVAAPRSGGRRGGATDRVDTGVGRRKRLKTLEDHAPERKRIHAGQLVDDRHDGQIQHRSTQATQILMRNEPLAKSVFGRVFA